MAPQKVLVTAASGRVGKALVAHLKARTGGKTTIRATVRDPSQGDYLKSIGADEICIFDLTQPATWRGALEGCDAIFSSSMDSLISDHMAFSKFMGENYGDAIKHVVRISCFGADTNTNSYDKDAHVSQAGAGIPLMLQHYWWSEECLIKAGLKVTAIRGNFYMNHLLKNETDNIRNEGYFSTCLGDCKNSFVCTNDMGEAAAVCLEEGPARHANKFYDVTGPTAQSMAEVAADLGASLGQSVVHRPIDFAQFEQDFGSTRAAFFEYLRNGFYTRCSPDFYNLTGKKATSYRDYLVDKGPFGETGIEELFSSAGAIFKKGEDAFKDLASVQKA